MTGGDKKAKKELVSISIVATLPKTNFRGKGHMNLDNLSMSIKALSQKDFHNVISNI